MRTQLDVRLADDYEAAHIPNALNIPVFEVGFLERVTEALPDKAAPIELYGASPESHEAAMALEKLERAGYKDVTILPDGFAGWLSDGYGVARGEGLPAPPAPLEGRKELDLEKSVLRWTGRNLLNHHTGTVAIERGHLAFENGQLASGQIVIDLERIDCDDLKGSDLHDVLIKHLQDHDFFDTSQHPKATLDIHSSERTQPEPGTENLSLKTELTLRGQTHALDILATAGVTEDGRAAAQSAFTIDRTKWGVIYGSGRFFDRLAGHLVNDLIELQVTIVTRP
ncbi:MAG: YceI family protein [Verrucomicrobiota bacterium JB023]|nr:YceI family protein [Verrucomicrobiota bacterium JB023]